MVIQNERFCLSVQVLQEFYVAAKKTYPGRPSANLPCPDFVFHFLHGSGIYLPATHFYS